MLVRVITGQLETATIDLVFNSHRVRNMRQCSLLATDRDACHARIAKLKKTDMSLYERFFPVRVLVRKNPTDTYPILTLLDNFSKMTK